VQLEVLADRRPSEQLVSDLGDVPAHRDDLEGDDVGLAGLLRPPEVGQAQTPVAPLPREVKRVDSSPVCGSRAIRSSPLETAGK
jgi:hypothetical protein